MPTILAPQRFLHVPFNYVNARVIRGWMIGLFLGLVALTGVHPMPLVAQAPEHTPGAWQKLEVGNFLFLYPKALEAWTEAVAEQMLAVESAVSELVGYRPSERIQIIVDDPLRISNGMAAPGPVIYLWPTPPGPRSMIGESRGWGELLAVHEYAHVAHLARPSRDPFRQALLSRAPLPLGPLFLGTPRWVAEGYATWIEGSVTGHGRPAGVWRPALFRTWALEGRLPAYRDLNGSDAFLSGAHAYLVGSAFIDWLIQREGRGPSVFQDVWARMSARENRGFDQAFEGIFGAPAEELYGLFVVDVMAQALEARGQLGAAGGLAEGTLFQRSTRALGDPAVSPDGAHLAFERREDTGVWNVVLVSTTPDTLSTEAQERRARIQERDPEDVPAVERLPRTQEAVATLAPHVGAAFRSPRWMATGDALLVIRDVLAPNRQVRPELFLWHWEEGSVRQVTVGQEIQEADPAPDGTWAAGIQCRAGRCDVVRVDLENGAVRTLAEGTLDAPFSSPRVSPDGTFIIASQPVDGVWSLIRISATGGPGERIGPADGAHRFDAAFIEQGAHAIVVSSRGGLLNLERISLEDPTEAPIFLTRTLGSVVAPAPAPDGSLYFLSYHSRGIDLRKMEATATAEAEGLQVPTIPSTLFPVASSGVTAMPDLERNPIPAPRPYGLGTLNLGYLPMVSWGAEGWSVGGLLQQMDPIGRLTVHLRGAGGAEGLWQGGSLAGRLRLGDVSIQLEGFRAEPRGARIPGGNTMIPEGATGEMLAAESPDPGAPPGGWGIPGPARALHARTTGFLLAGGWDQRRDAESRRMGGGFSVESHATGPRRQGWVEGSLSRAISLSTDQPSFLVPSVMAELQMGSTDGARWSRQRLETALIYQGAGPRVTLRSGLGRVSGEGSEVEVFSLGGSPSLILDERVLSGTLPLPYLDRAQVQGQRYRMLDAAVGTQAMGELFVTRYRISGAQGTTRAIGLRSSERVPLLPMLRIPDGALEGGSAYVLTNRATGENGHFRSWISIRFKP